MNSSFPDELLSVAHKFEVRSLKYEYFTTKDEKGRGQKAEDRREKRHFLSLPFCLLPPTFCLLTTELSMTYLAIIYNPEAEKRQLGLPFGMRGDRVFFYPVERPKTKGERERVELETVVLKKGTNFIDTFAWESVKRHISNEPDINRLVKFGAITVYAPDVPETAAKDTTDFADESVVQELVENITDTDWLKLCINVDRRIPIRKLIGDRLKDLDEERSAMRQRISSPMG